MKLFNDTVHVKQLKITKYFTKQKRSHVKSERVPKTVKTKTQTTLGQFFTKPPQGKHPLKKASRPVEVKPVPVDILQIPSPPSTSSYEMEKKSTVEEKQAGSRNPPQLSDDDDFYSVKYTIRGKPGKK